MHALHTALHASGSTFIGRIAPVYAVGKAKDFASTNGRAMLSFVFQDGFKMGQAASLPEDRPTKTSKQDLRPIIQVEQTLSCAVETPGTAVSLRIASVGVAERRRPTVSRKRKDDTIDVSQERCLVCCGHGQEHPGGTSAIARLFSGVAFRHLHFPRLPPLPPLPPSTAFWGGLCSGCARITRLQLPRLLCCCTSQLPRRTSYRPR